MRHFDNRYWKTSLLALMLLGVAAAPSLAQGAGETNKPNEEVTFRDKVVTLDLEGVDLYQALTLLFKQAKVQYSLDNSLRGALVTIHIKQPFKNALEAVLKSSGLPVTYRFEDGVYSIIPIKEEEPVPVAEEPRTEAKRQARIVRIPIHNLNAIQIASMLGGRILRFTDAFGPGTFGFNPFAGGMMGGNMGGMGGGMGGFGGQSGGLGAGGLGGFGQTGGIGGAGRSTFGSDSGIAGGSGGRGF